MALAESGGFSGPGSPLTTIGPAEMPVEQLSNLGHLVDAAKQQTELIVWMADKLQQHELRLQALSDRAAATASSAGWKVKEKSSKHSRVTTAGGDTVGALSEVPSLGSAPGTRGPDGFAEVGEDLATSMGIRGAIDEEGASPRSAEDAAADGSLSPEGLHSRHPSAGGVGEEALLDGEAPGGLRAGFMSAASAAFATRQLSTAGSGVPGSESLGGVEERLEELARYMQDYVQEQLALVSKDMDRRLQALQQDAMKASLSQSLGPDGSPTKGRSQKLDLLGLPGGAFSIQEPGSPRLASGAEAGADAASPGSEQGSPGVRNEASASPLSGARASSPFAVGDPVEQLQAVQQATHDLQKKMDLVHVDELRDIRLEHTAVKADVNEMQKHIKTLARELAPVLSGRHRDALMELAGPAKDATGSGSATPSSRRHQDGEGGKEGSKEISREGGWVRAEGVHEYPRDEEDEDHDSDKLGDLDSDEQARLRLTSVESKLKSFEEEFKTNMRKLTHSVEVMKSKNKEEEEGSRRMFKAWNLANQVDVIQSVCAEEMRYVKDQLMKDMKANAASLGLPRQVAEGDASAQDEKVDGQAADKVAALSETQFKEMTKELEEKIRRLQENYQQNTLKIAGLKSATRAIEHTAGTALDKSNKLADEIDNMADTVLRHDVRLERVTTMLASELPIDHQHGAESPPTADELDHVNAHQTGPAGMRKDTSTGSVASMDSRGSVLGVLGKHGGRKGPRRRSWGGGMPAGSEGSADEASSEAAHHSQSPVRRDTMAARGSILGGPGPVGDEGITARFVRLGKKVTDLQGETTTQLTEMSATLTMLGSRLGMMESFLPKRQRRLVQKILALDGEDGGKEGKDKDDDEEKVKKEKKSKKDKKEDSKEKKGVAFSEVVDKKEFRVEEDMTELPWQKVGEPDQKWSWCFQPRNEMGRDLASHFQVMEDERQEFEDQMHRALEDLKKMMKDPRIARKAQRSAKISEPTMESQQTGSGDAASPTGAASAAEYPSMVLLEPAEADESLTTALSGGITRINQRLEKAVLPKLQELEDRVDRMVSDVKDHKKGIEVKLESKAEKQRVEVVALRLAVFDDVDPTKLESRLEASENNFKYLEQLCDKLGVQIRKTESAAVGKAEITKIWQEISGVKVEAQKVGKNMQEVVSNGFNSNQRMSLKIDDVSRRLEKDINTLQHEKAMYKDVVEVAEKVRQLEIALKTSAKAMTEGSGPEVNVVVKRIILGMEDKLMVLENKIQALSEGRPLLDVDPAMVPVPASPPATRPGGGQPPRALRDVKERLLHEVEAASQAVQKLKQDVGISKADLEGIKEQISQHVGLAQRINVLVEDASQEVEDPSAALSLSRVQVMIAAAARQLVAGSKWVTKDAFDQRMGEVRKELQANSRQLMVQVEELVGSSGGKAPPIAPAGGSVGLLPKVVDAKRTGPLGGATLQLQYVESERAVQSARGAMRKQDFGAGGRKLIGGSTDGAVGLR